MDRNTANKMDVGIADDQARDFDFVKTEMKYDSTGMFHWIPARSIEDCILVSRHSFSFSVHGLFVGCVLSNLIKRHIFVTFGRGHIRERII